jgi:hypothetical protein
LHVSGALKAGVAWHLYNTSTADLDVFGLAANNLSAIELVYSGHIEKATLANNIFYVNRPIRLTSTTHLPAFGKLICRHD